MNITQLIKELEKIEDKDNTAVVLEGCDCEGAWDGTLEIYQYDYYEPYKKYLLLKR
jgi:hypothetical protein